MFKIQGQWCLNIDLYKMNERKGREREIERWMDGLVDFSEWFVPIQIYIHQIESLISANDELPLDTNN